MGTRRIDVHRDGKHPHSTNAWNCLSLGAVVVLALTGVAHANPVLIWAEHDGGVPISGLPGYTGYTVYLNSNDPDDPAGGWWGSFDGPMAQIKAFAELDTPTMSYVAFLGTDFDKDSHFLFYNEDIIAAVNPHESENHLGGEFGMLTSAYQQNLPFAYFAIEDGDQVIMTGQTIAAKGEIFDTDLVLPEPGSLALLALAGAALLRGRRRTRPSRTRTSRRRPIPSCGARKLAATTCRRTWMGLVGTGTVLVAVLFVAANEAQAGKMYWVDALTCKVQRADLDGSNPEDLVATGLRNPTDIDLDLSAGKMYWADPGAHRIQRADLDGSNVEDLVTAAPSCIALDASAGMMYWTERTNAKICRADLNGSNSQDLITGLGAPKGLALDLSAGKMYWTDSARLKIRRADLDGSNIEDLVTTGLSAPDHIAVDPAGGKVYWTDFINHKIQRANLDGSDVEDMVDLGWRGPFGIALDLSAGKIYWTDWTGNRIERSDLDGTNVEALVTTGLENPAGIAVPEPGILALVGIGTLTLMRRRHRWPGVAVHAG